MIQSLKSFFFGLI